MGTTEKEVEKSTKNQEKMGVESPVENSVDNPAEEPVEQEMESTLEERVESQIEEQVESSEDGLEKNEGEEPTEKEVTEPTEEPGEEPIEKQMEEGGENPEGSSEENLVEKPVEEEVEDTVEKPIKKYKKIVIGTIISVSILLVFYFGMTKYFMNRFYFGSEINSISVSGKTVEEVETLMASELQDYSLNLKERGGKIEQIKAADVGLKYNSGEELKKLKDNQNPFNWILACFNAKDSKMSVGVSYDEKLLKERIDKLSCFESSNLIEPKNPSFKYVDNSYVIVDEVVGNKIDKDILYSHVKDSLLKEKVELDLESINCYIKPQYESKSQKVIEAKDTLNKYVSSKITYNSRGNKETLDGSTINKWLTVNEKFEVLLDEEKVKDYIDVLAKTYNTIGRTRSFVTSSGKAINIGGGDYGLSISKSKETQNLIAAIKEGKTITKEPAYSQTAFSNSNNDLGNTYVEIDISSQHLWFYKNGSLIIEGNVVTGNVKSGHATPKGIYKLKYKKMHVVLTGPDYASPVTFWMPFNGGIGIHDASWRSVFGGSIYRTNGSHGCVNSPYNLAKTIYNNIEPGTPVICY